MKDKRNSRRLGRHRFPGTGWKLHFILGLCGSIVIAASIIFIARYGVLDHVANKWASMQSAEDKPPQQVTSDRQAAETQSVDESNKRDAAVTSQALLELDREPDISTVESGASVDVTATSKRDDAGLISEKIEEQDNEPPQTEAGDLSISGRILTQAGVPVPGIVATARLLDRGDGSNYRGQSDGDGFYEIRGLSAGEYQIQTIATDLYPSAFISARAGLHSADIVLTEGRTVEVFGTVVDVAGTPLAAVEVASNPPSKSVRTDDSGNYVLSLIAQSTSSYIFRYKLAGYQEEQIVVSGMELLEAGKKRADATLTAVGDTIDVTGVVRNEFGEGVSSARIYLQSTTRALYQGVSDRQGNFSIPDVKIGAGYRLTVTSAGLYERYVSESLIISPDNPPIEITLKSLAAGRVSGNMIDLHGNSIPNFTLLLSNTKAMSKHLPVNGDGFGYFEIDRVPEGELIFMTRSKPTIQIRGVFLEPGSDVVINLVLDWGYESVVGTVVDNAGHPVAGARVSLTWAYASDGVQSGSSRQTIADGSGSFRFTQLGPGIHTLAVSAPGYQPIKENYDVGRESRDITVLLKPQ
ncbi:MAG: carboxypeptidase-like regulatory domain-containing protein [Gammaproteobacteria bacterium]|nr:carboxypeptidase-like regulatory domain-containing protein [Gammaproteobacteria bacterium]